MLKMQRVIFNLVFETPLFVRMNVIHLFFVCFFYFCFIAKQRIDSGFFLFQAEQRKKKEKKKLKNAMKKSREVMISSDDEFV